MKDPFPNNGIRFFDLIVKEPKMNIRFMVHRPDRKFQKIFNKLGLEASIYANRGTTNQKALLLP